MRRTRRTLPAAVAALALLLTACGGPEGPSLASQKTPRDTAATTPPTTVPAVGSFIARATVPTVSIYDAPGGTTPVRQFESPWYFPTDTNRQYPIDSVFFATERRDGWVKVQLPVRPNGATGWVRASDVTVTNARFRIEVDLSDHHLTVYDGDKVYMEDTVAIGKPSTPTPIGLFYLRVLLKAPDPTTVYGPYAYGLSGYSEALEEFAGGDAQVGLHGNNDASQLGKDVSSGCIRMDNAKITQLAGVLPLGTPVLVRE
jgi:lipoprotein-anchoring transpeptidase ErfK/SrfK